MYQSLSTRRVLVMEEINGVTVADQHAIAAAPVSANVLAARLLQSFLDQVLRDGLYHADPHPGNIFVDPGGTLWFLDFGAVGRLSPIDPRVDAGDGDRVPAERPRHARPRQQRLAGGDESGDSRALEADIGLVLSEGLGSRELRPQGDEHDARDHEPSRARGAERR